MNPGTGRPGFGRGAFPAHLHGWINTVRSAAAAWFFVVQSGLCAAPQGLAGNWIGSLHIASTPLRVAFSIEVLANGSLAGRMHSLDQGVHNLALSNIELARDVVRLQIPSLNAVFQGKLNDTGDQLLGEWLQAGKSFPLTLARTTVDPALEPAETLSSAELAASRLAARQLSGVWDGFATVLGTNVDLRIKVWRSAAGAAKGTLDSLTNVSRGLPLKKIAVEAGKVHFAVPGLGASFDGTVNDHGDILEGIWRQWKQDHPLVLQKAPPPRRRLPGE